MPLVDVSDVVNDSDFAQEFYLLRSSGTFVLGGWQNDESPIPMWGCIQVATENDLDTVPQGDRVTGAMSFHTSDPIYLTRVEGGAYQQSYGIDGYGAASNGLSDVVLWNNQKYRIVKQYPWADYGYYKTVGLRTSGD